MRTFLLSMLFISSLFSNQFNMEAEAISGFELERYLGTWYEIARMDHSFERGMSQVTANYSLKENGDVQVINKGYVKEKGKWKTANGTARFKGAPDVAALKVTFFWPFYGGYHVVELAEDYSYALIAGDSPKYLWILSRTPEISEEIWQLLIQRASALGYATSELIIVDQTPIDDQAPAEE